jgi:hypothetical protein
VIEHAHIAHAIDTSPLNRGRIGAEWLASPGNIPITFDNGDIALFDDEGDRVFQVHFLFNSRGKEAIANAREAFRAMFEEHGADTLFGLTPVSLHHARLFNRWIGGVFVGVRETPAGPCALYVLSKTKWKLAQ